jgi:hypothetical protein
MRPFVLASSSVSLRAAFRAFDQERPGGALVLVVGVALLLMIAGCLLYWCYLVVQSIEKYEDALAEQGAVDQAARVQGEMVREAKPSCT